MADISRTELRELVHDTVKETLLTLGIDGTDPMEVLAMQKDFAHLRGSRLSSERIQTKSVLIAVGVVVTGIISLLVVGLQSLLKGS